jgi:hypothetical protein
METDLETIIWRHIDVLLPQVLLFPVRRVGTEVLIVCDQRQLFDPSNITHFKGRRVLFKYR